MNPLFNILARLAFQKVANDVLTQTAPAPKPKGKAKVVVAAKKNWKPLMVGIATVLCAGLGVYTGHIDGTTALSMLGSIDFNGIFGN